MFCKNCGKRLDYQETICPRCGAKIEETKEKNESIEAPIHPIKKKYTILSILVLPLVIGIWCTKIGVHYYIALLLSLLGIIWAKNGEKKEGQIARICKWANYLFLAITLFILLLHFLVTIY